MEKDKNSLVPRLRFKEFSGEWEEKKIEDVFESFSGGTPTTSKKQYYGGNIPFIRSAEIDKAKTELFLTEEGLENSSAKLVAKGDLLVALYGANSGDSAISKIDGAINQAILCLQSGYSNNYVYNYLTLRKEQIVSKYIQGGQGNLSGNIIKSITLPFPSEDEQQKIANTLSSLDHLIESEQSKLEQLQEHKKGLMQNLFPQEGETMPKFRFKEFENDGEWEETAIESIGNVITGSTPSKKQNDYWDGDFVWTTAQDFSKKYIYDSVLKLSKKGKAKTRVIPKNSVLVTCIASIGLNAINKVECATNQQINSIVCNSSFYYEFVYYVIEANINRLKNLAGQTAVPIINKSSFEKFVVLTPNITEQQKISETLSSLDQLISAQTERIELLQEHKKGLMQGMFPG